MIYDTPDLTMHTSHQFNTVNMSDTFKCVNASVACLVVFSDLVPYDLSMCINF